MDPLTRRQFFGLTAGALALAAAPELPGFDTLPIVSTIQAPTTARVAYLTGFSLRSTLTTGHALATVWLASPTQRLLVLAKDLKPDEVFIPEMPLAMGPDTRLVIEGPVNYEFLLHWVEH